MCEALVDGWNSDWQMSRVVSHAWILAGMEDCDVKDKYEQASESLRVKNIYGKEYAKVWIAKNMRNLNEALWAGRQRAACVACAQKLLVGRRKSAPMPFSPKDRDVRSDWDTVK